jgi:hypothetical protein
LLGPELAIAQGAGLSARRRRGRRGCHSGRTPSYSTAAAAEKQSGA